MTKKEVVKLKRWEWIYRHGLWTEQAWRFPRKMERALRYMLRQYGRIGYGFILLPYPLGEDPQLIFNKRYRWIVEELDELPEGPVTPKK